MENGSAEDLKDELVSAGVGTYAATSGWSIAVSREPISPDSVITLIDTGSSQEPNPKFLLDYPTIQARIRGNKLAYQAAYDKAREVLNALIGLPSKTINTTVYKGVWATSDVMFLKYDKENRPIMVCNFRIVREPASGTNRQSF